MDEKLNKAFKEQVDQPYLVQQDTKVGGRGHLGASVLGRKCVRQVWYGFRWAYIVKHTGRILRLFERGKKEENRLIQQLRDAGYEIRQYSEKLLYDPSANFYRKAAWEDAVPEGWKEVTSVEWHVRAAEEVFGLKLGQDNFSDHKGHMGGEGDGKIRGLSEEFLGKTLPNWITPEMWGLIEFKTHNTKSFVNLSSKGLLSAKPEHYVQMQVYMKYFGLKFGLYVAVNKNDDDLYFEIVAAKPELSEAYRERAGLVISAAAAPPRITNDASWFECKFCDFREICHHGKEMQRSCRSCAYAVPVDDGQWACSKFHQIIPKDFIPAGCEAWEQLGG